MNRIYVSGVCVWEAVIKRALGRLELAEGVDLVAAITDSGFEELAVTARHSQRVGELPPVHSDPFDRMLVAQGLEEDLRLVTYDAVIHDYPEVALFEVRA